MTSSPEVAQIAEAIRARQRFVLSSHARPDGDSIGSQLAMAYTLRAMGKHVEVVNADPAPPMLMPFPGVGDIRIASHVDGDFDAAIIMECGSLARTGVGGLDRFFVINIDHHQGNTGYGQINWFDGSACACGEMVFDVVKALGVPLSVEMATHIYVAIVTDTGSFHYSTISPRTFDICRQLLLAGVDPVAVSRAVWDSNNLSRLKLIGAILNAMEVDPSGRIAILSIDQAIAHAAGGSYDDTEGLINMPLSVKAIDAVVFFKHDGGGAYRVSMRSKGDIDVSAVAKAFGGGGHKNAAGCNASGPLEALKTTFAGKIQAAMDASDGRPARR